MTSYPIIEQRSLPKAGRRGPRGIGFRSRLASDLPMPKAHEAVVYKSGGSYILDRGRSRLTDEHVLNATNISVVDMRENAPVTVHASIPSAGAAEFTVQVTFHCTVRKPEEVVEAGLIDMEEPLTHFLKRHQPLFHVGEDFEFDEITTVRSNVEAEVRAYVAVKPPRFRGIDVALGSVEVLTPEEYAEFERLRRERRQDHMLEQERQELQQHKDLTRQRDNHELKTQAEQYSHELADMRRRLDEQQELETRRYNNLMTQLQQQFDQTQQQQQLSHDQQVRSSTFEHAISEAHKLQAAIGADQSELPHLLTASAGEQTIAQTAAMLNSDRQQKRDAESADSLRRETWSREDAQAAFRAEREDAVIRFNLKADQIRAQLEVYKAAIARGLADTETIDKLVGVINGAVRELEGASGSVPGQPATAPAQVEIASDPSDVYEAEFIEEPYGDRPADAGNATREAMTASDSGPSDGGSTSTGTEFREEDFGL